jgi:hypothetical protein
VRETLGVLGLPQVRVAKLLGVRPRHLRRWRRGDRPIPHGVGIVLQLLSAGTVTLAQVEEAAAFVRADSSTDPGPVTATVIPVDPDSLAAVVSIDPDSVAGKVVALPLGACKWPLGGDPADPAQAHDFRFCGRPAVCGGCPAVFGSYCPEHARLAYIPGTSSRSVAALRLNCARLDQPREPEIESIDREDGAVVARAAWEHSAAALEQVS